MRYGRPIKSGSRRAPITIHAPSKTVDVIDAFVEEYGETTGTAYSRSDFYQEAAEALLRSKGIDPETGERNKSVTEKTTLKPNEDNINN